MTMSQPSTLRFSTADFPERDRLPMFHEMFGRCVANMDVTPLGDECRAEIELRMFPGASVMWGGNSAHRFEKGRDLGKADDDCVLVWSTSPWHVEHLGREIEVGVGPAVLKSCAERMKTENPLPIEHVTLKVPRAFLKPLVVGLEDAFMRPVPAETNALRLLKGYLATIHADHESADIDLQRAMVLHIHDLIALTLGATRDAAAQANSRGVPAAARLNAMKKHVLEKLGDPAFAVANVAHAQGVTPRYVQMLFERDGQTFSSFLLHARLSLAHRRLSDLNAASLPIGTIAADCGFGDLSYFNQCFRRAFGETPTDVRNRARRGRSN